MKDSCKITLVQLPSGSDDAALQASLRRFFGEAAAYGSDLVVFPEYCLGNRITCEHPNVQTLQALAAEHRMYAIAGLVESHGERWATTALMVDRSGSILGRYLKTHPASGPAPHYWPPVAGEDSEARGILGSQFKVFHLDFGPVGILQCYDGYFPEAWACTAYEGAEVILWINGRGGFIEDYLCHTAAHAYGCVVGANISDGYNTGFAGRGLISAEGARDEMRLFPRIPARGPGCVHAEIDLKKLRWVRKHLRTMHQRRPELYHRLTEDIKLWQDYPDIPWDTPEAWEFINKAQL
ncbi:MAG: carbon-nitrogen hydrolase family protein [Anaerolineae bacterium]